jgi:hypothetical protein
MAACTDIDDIHTIVLILEGVVGDRVVICSSMPFFDKQDSIGIPEEPVFADTVPGGRCEKDTVIIILKQVVLNRGDA